MKEIEMLNQLGAVLDRSIAEGTEVRVRKIVQGGVDKEYALSRRGRRPVGRLIIAVALGVVVVGGIAVANGFGDGAGVEAPPADKIPFVQARIDQIEADLVALDTSTKEGRAKGDYLNVQLARVNEVLAELCAAAGQTESCQR